MATLAMAGGTDEQKDKTEFKGNRQSQMKIVFLQKDDYVFIY